MVDVGRFTRRFTIQKPTRTQNAFGEVTISWSDVARRWGSLRAITGRDLLNAAQIQSEVTHEIVMRKNPGLTIQPDWRLVSDSRTFEVKEVLDNDDRKRQWNIECSEVVSV